MSIIAKYIEISIKKCFIKRANAFFVALDTIFYCMTTWIFWQSMLEMGIEIPGWKSYSVQMFIGFVLIAKAICNLFVGNYDIEDHVTEGSLDIVLIKPYNPIVLILLERPNYFSFAITMIAGLCCVFIYCPSDQIMTACVSVLMCIIAAVLLSLLETMIYVASFWLKKSDFLADIYMTITDLFQYPLIFMGKKLFFFFSYIIPITFVGTRPTQIVERGVTWEEIVGLLVLTVVIVGGLSLEWNRGRRKYESTN